ncbi:hypothetical protein P5V15_015505 [Pogonomyrmex californicus]
MTSHCDSNPAQYERNRRFGHLVHALGRAAGGAKLPSVGLCLNASKAVSSLVKGGNDISRSLVPPRAKATRREPTFASPVRRRYRRERKQHAASRLYRATPSEVPPEPVGGTAENESNTPRADFIVPSGRRYRPSERPEVPPRAKATRRARTLSCYPVGGTAESESNTPRADFRIARTPEVPPRAKATRREPTLSCDTVGGTARARRRYRRERKQHAARGPCHPVGGTARASVRRYRRERKQHAAIRLYRATPSEVPPRTKATRREPTLSCDTVGGTARARRRYRRERKQHAARTLSCAIRSEVQPERASGGTAENESNTPRADFIVLSGRRYSPSERPEVPPRTKATRRARTLSCYPVGGTAESESNTPRADFCIARTPEVPPRAKATRRARTLSCYPVGGTAESESNTPRADFCIARTPEVPPRAKATRREPTFASPVRRRYRRERKQHAASRLLHRPYAGGTAESESNTPRADFCIARTPEVPPRAKATRREPTFASPVRRRYRRERKQHAASRLYLATPSEVPLEPVGGTAENESNTPRADFIVLSGRRYRRERKQHAASRLYRATPSEVPPERASGGTAESESNTPRADFCIARTPEVPPRAKATRREPTLSCDTVGGTARARRSRLYRATPSEVPPERASGGTAESESNTPRADFCIARTPEVPPRAKATRREPTLSCDTVGGTARARRRYRRERKQHAARGLYRAIRSEVQPERASGGTAENESNTPRADFIVLSGRRYSPSERPEVPPRTKATRRARTLSCYPVGGTAESESNTPRADFRIARTPEVPPRAKATRREPTFASPVRRRYRRERKQHAASRLLHRPYAGGTAESESNTPRADFCIARTPEVPPRAKATRREPTLSCDTVGGTAENESNTPRADFIVLSDRRYRPSERPEVPPRTKATRRYPTLSCDTVGGTAENESNTPRADFIVLSGRRYRRERKQHAASRLSHRPYAGGTAESESNTPRADFIVRHRRRYRPCPSEVPPSRSEVPPSPSVFLTSIRFRPSGRPILSNVISFSLIHPVCAVVLSLSTRWGRSS